VEALAAERGRVVLTHEQDRAYLQYAERFLALALQRPVGPFPVQGFFGVGLPASAIGLAMDVRVAV
jgi:hypothetical protein